MTDTLSSGTGPWGAWTGDSSRHFDYDDTCKDSRLTNAMNDMNAALSLWKMKRVGDAALLLGRGLHSLQDYYAHRDWDPRALGPDWVAHPPWYDNVTDKRNTMALENTKMATERYIEYFKARMQ